MLEQVQHNAILKWIDIDDKNQSKFLDQNITSIGRSSDNDIVILDKRISRYHAEIIFNDDYHFIRDLDSINGVYLDDIRIINDERVNNNSIIKVGPISFTYEVVIDNDSYLKNKIQTTIIVPENKSMPHIEIISGAQVGVIFEITKNEILIGRPDTNMICDLIINDRAISRPHAKIVHDQNIYTLIDLNSANGTFVNGQKIIEPYQLANTDSIKIGESDIIFYSGT